MILDSKLNSGCSYMSQIASLQIKLIHLSNKAIYITWALDAVTGNDFRAEGEYSSHLSLWLLSSMPVSIPSLPLLQHFHLIHRAYSDPVIFCINNKLNKYNFPFCHYCGAKRCIGASLPVGSTHPHGSNSCCNSCKSNLATATPLRCIWSKIIL